MGSVKDLIVIKKPSEEGPGVGRFIFSDRYSVFDWGEMPDHIAKKGQAICLATAYFFEKLEESGIKTHYRGVVEKGQLKRLKDLDQPTDTIEITLLRVIKPEIKDSNYDYSIYRQIRSNFLIPLEIIYRNSLPEGSSIFKRLREGQLKLEDIGLKEMPSPGQVLEKPIFDVSTKLEVTDRYVTWDEAKEIADLSEDEVEEMKRILSFINELITKEAKRMGLYNEDGKIELGFDEHRNFIVVDALGTLDECRFTYEGLPVSKEIARIFYRKTEWYQEVEQAKKKDSINWKSLVKNPPQALPKELLEAISFIYQAYTNELTGKKWFEAPSINEVLNTVKKLI